MSMKTGKFEISRNKRTGKFHFVLKSKNGTAIIKSEGYTRRFTCARAIKSLTSSAVDAVVIDKTVE